MIAYLVTKGGVSIHDRALNDHGENLSNPVLYNATLEIGVRQSTLSGELLREYIFVLERVYVIQCQEAKEVYGVYFYRRGLLRESNHKHRRLSTESSR